MKKKYLYNFNQFGKIRIEHYIKVHQASMVKNIKLLYHSCESLSEATEFASVLFSFGSDGFGFLFLLCVMLSSGTSSLQQ